MPPQIQPAIPDAFKDAPTIGLPMIVGEPTVIQAVTCRCRPENPPMLLRSVEQAAVCIHCKTAYAIANVDYAFRERPLRVEVTQIVLQAP